MSNARKVSLVVVAHVEVDGEYCAMSCVYSSGAFCTLFMQNVTWWNTPAPLRCDQCKLSEVDTQKLVAKEPA